MPTTISPHRAAEIASQWGSLVRSGDPGACFYGFPLNGHGVWDGRPADEEHRAACLAYCEDLIRRVEAFLASDTADRLGWTKADSRRLRSLRRFFLHAETREAAENRRRAFDELDAFTRAYITAALWSSTDNSDESGGNPLDDNYGPEDIAPDTLARMVKDCADFQKEHAGLLSLAGDAEQNGHDFWLTRNDHGAGFWDRGYRDGIGESLTEAAHAYGSVDLTVEYDGKIYGC